MKNKYRANYLVILVDCPMCGGIGETIEPILDDGSGPTEHCGYCNGTGKIKKDKFYFQCLGWLRGDSRRKKKGRRFRNR